MSCKYCKENWFWKKIGRCQRCMDQLTVLSVVCWIAWWFLFRDNPATVESVALIFAGFAFNGLLFLHLLYRFIVIPYRRRHGLEEDDE
jgi:hypothetical protein